MRPGGFCEVKPEMRCVWVLAWDGAARMRGGARIREVLPPVDHRLKGSSAWLRAGREKAAALREARDAGRTTLARAFPKARAIEPATAPLADEPPRAREPRPVTELPGDHIRPYEEPPPGMSSGSRLERALRAGKFAVTAELNPPDSADPADVFEAARPLSEVCDAINATDASGANCHMSSIGICALLTRAGYGTIYQISCRDRNRIAIQGDVLGAAAMGVRNVLCLTGDGTGVGDQPGAKPVFDFDSLTLLRTIRTMRDDGVFLSGRPITRRPHMFLGAAENPCVPPYEAGAPSGSPRRSTPAPSSSRPTTSSTCRRSSASWPASATSASTGASSSSPASARSPRPRRRAGCGRTSRASTSPTRSSSGWSGRRSRPRRAPSSASS